MELIDELVDQLRERRVVFPADRDAHARELRNTQGNRWSGALRAIEARGFGKGNLQNQFTNALRILADALTRVDSSLFTIEQADNDWIVVGRLPLLRSDVVMTELIEQNHLQVLAALLAEGADVFMELLMQIGQDPSIIEPLGSLPISILTVRYLIAKTSVHSLAAVDAKMVEVLDRVSRIDTDARAQVAKVIQQLDDLQTRGEQIVTAGRQQIDDFRSSHDREWKEFMTASQREIEATKALAGEVGALKGATAVWHDKVWSHRLIFYGGLVGLVILVATGFFFFIDNFQAIDKAVPRKQDGDIAYGWLVLLAIPVVAVGWVLRIIVRLVTNSLILLEDAEQRRAMLRTYFALVGDPHAKMEPTDRILVLNAIFRPLPGHQSGEVAPPTLADLVKTELGGGGGARS